MNGGTMSSILQRGTYARESGGGCLLYHSDTSWNDASYALRQYLDEGEARSSLYSWRRVDGAEAQAVWDWCKLGPGESIEYEDREPERSEHYRDGSQAGSGAASWIDIEGVAAARWLLRGIADGDPEVMDLQPSPLSGEWAGESLPELIDGYADMTAEDQDAACDDYEAGFSDAFWRELQRRAESFVAIDGATLDREGRYRVVGWPAVAVYIIDQYADKAVVVMVGDDTKHIVDAGDLEPIGDDDYCPGCGQIGCTCYGTAEERKS